jgi:hypothetical protein
LALIAVIRRCHGGQKASTLKALTSIGTVDAIAFPTVRSA